MKEVSKTKKELMKELEEMNKMMVQLEKCQQEFQQARERYVELLESAPDAMIFVDGQGKIFLVNAQLEKMFGYRREELIGQPLELLVPERYHKKHVEDVRGYLTAPRLRPMGSGLDICGVKKDGTDFPADISLSPLHTREGVIIAGAIRDISERKQAEHQIELNYHMQRVMCSILQTSLEPTSLDDQLERILEKILSVPHLALQSRGWIYLVEKEPDVLVLKARRGFPESVGTHCVRVPFGKCLCGKAADSREVLYADATDARHEVPSEGTHPHGHYCVPIVSDGKTLGLINISVKEGHERTGAEERFLEAVANMLAGIIERKRTEAEKLELQKKLAQAETLAALGRLTRNIAHEIRNPLTSVGGFARRLQKSLTDESADKKYVDLILSDVKRLEEILKSVLTFVREEGLQRETCNLHELLDEVLEEEGDQCRAGAVEVRKSYASIPVLSIDRGLVQEVFQVMVSNAIVSMPEGGTLTIRTDKKEVYGRPYVLLQFTDTSAGIPKAALEKIFEPFYTGKGFVSGSHLGLPICKKVVEEHGGFIQVESGAGQGTIFKIYFPLKAN
jgi:PAS domain S-box-containing protein